MKGFFITIYGVNNIGKSTQAKLLISRLRAAGHECVLLKYPVYDLAPTGPKLNEILRSGSEQKISEEELQTLFMQNRRDAEPRLIKLLEEGKIVVAEDYIGTGLAWGTAKGADQEWLEELNENLLQEDLAILLVGKRFLEGRETNHIHESDDVLTERVRKILLKLSRKYDWIQVLSLPGEVKRTADEIWKLVKTHIKRR